MRSVLLLWLLAVVLARAEEPADNGLLSHGDNYLNPRLEDHTPRPYVAKDFDASKSAQTRNSSTGPFRFIQKLFGKPFATREFSSKQYHTGDFRVAPAKMPKEDRQAKKTANVSQFSTPQAPEGTKSAVTGGHTIERGKSQDLFDQGPGSLGQSQYQLDKEGPGTRGVGWKGKLDPLSIDDVRELLNKSK